MSKNNFKWTLEKLQEEANKYKTRGEFCKGSPSAYGTASGKKILDQICSHMKNLRHRKTNEELQQEALQYNSRDEFIKKCWNSYIVAHRRGILDNICSHMTYTKIQWTDEMLQKEALKYKTRTDFVKNKRSAYFIALDRGILDNICSHMEYKIHYWDNKEIVIEALKYKTRGEFCKGSPSAYSIAHKRGLLNEICDHMKASCGSSNLERDLLNEIKSIFPKAQKFRDTKVKIEGRSYIQGFDIDIYIPELRKGIEFDGKYHHSFSGLKRARPNWSDEDIYNYHQIKDGWFLSKGVKILHIKEEDWKKDKGDCVDRCMAFLRGENVEQTT